MPSVEVASVTWDVQRDASRVRRLALILFSKAPADDPSPTSDAAACSSAGAQASGSAGVQGEA